MTGAVVHVCRSPYSLAWSLAAYRTLTTAVSVSVFTEGEGDGGVRYTRRLIHSIFDCE